MKRATVGSLTLVLLGLLCAVVWAFEHTSEQVDGMKDLALLAKGFADSTLTQMNGANGQAVTAKNAAVAMRDSVPAQYQTGYWWEKGLASLSAGDGSMTAGGQDNTLGGDLYDCAALAYNYGYEYRWLPPPFDLDVAYNSYDSARESWDSARDSFYDAYNHAANAKIAYDNATYEFDQCY